MHKLNLTQDQKEMLYDGNVLCTLTKNFYFLPHIFIERNGEWFGVQPEEVDPSVLEELIPNYKNK